jgi:membrane-associated phospholipid phosphatase
MSWTQVRFWAPLIAATFPAFAQACGWSIIDHRVGYDGSGLWNPNVYRDIEGALTLAQIGGAIYEGADSRFGKTMWQGIDSEIISGVSAQAGKYIFTRSRPRTENNPCQWFQGGSNYSFPSSEAAVAAGLVTPYILEYGSERPATYLLALVPLYIGVARINNQAHWQSDILGGWVIGGLSGWYAHSRDIPITVQVLPRGLSVGYRKEF